MATTPSMSGTTGCCRNVPTAPRPSCPDESPPQQRIVPSKRTAQPWRSLTETCAASGSQPVTCRKKSGELHSTLQLAPSQAVVASLNKGHTVHAAPQPAVLVGSRHLPLQSRKPGKQVKAQTPLLQTGCDELGAGHGEQRRPHESVLESGT